MIGPRRGKRAPHSIGFLMRLLQKSVLEDEARNVQSNAQRKIEGGVKWKEIEIVFSWAA